jgi:hypothetical protein
MLEITAALTVWGEHFRPSEVEQLASIGFSSKNESGEVGRKGRYAGVPKPYGSAELLMPSVSIEEAGGATALLDVNWLKQLDRIIPYCRDAGATDMEVHVDVSYDGQCNVSLSANELAALAALRIPLTMTCYSR